MSTVEITSLHANKIVQEFKKYYDKARSSPSGEFKSYIVKADQSDRIERLKRLLDRNGIDWSYANMANFSGFNYFTIKNENFKTGTGDIVINSNQSHSNLISVLFERNSRLSDSVTYDITAWSVPYAYGLSTYGLNQYVTNTTTVLLSTPNAILPSTPAYAYAVKWNGLHSARFLSALINKGIKVRYAEYPFYSKGKSFDKGTLLVTRTSNASHNKALGNIVHEAAQKSGIDYTLIESGFVDKGFDVGSDKVRMIKAPRITLVGGDYVSSLSMGEIWHFLIRKFNILYISYQ